MYLGTKNLIGFTIESGKETIGELKDFLFDDEKWGIRYLVVDTGTWLKERKVLVSPGHINPVDQTSPKRRFRVDLTAEQLANAPPLDAAAPVSRRYEKEFAEHFNHYPYWIGPGLWGPTMDPSGLASAPPSPEEAAKHNKALERIEECHVRSVNEVMDYRIAASDGEIGHIEDFIMDTQSWKLRHAVVNTRNWIPGRKVVIDIDWIHEFVWESGLAKVDLTQDQIKESPKFDPTLPVNRDYEKQLYDYYGRSYPW